MKPTNAFDFEFPDLEYSYLSLPSKFYQLVQPAFFESPERVFLNEGLCKQLCFSINDNEKLLLFLLGLDPKRDAAFAQAYAGYQFGHFTKLGDGRAIMLGEYMTPSRQRFDLQLKGGGKTRYSRGGDGRATFKAMLREYLMSEAMHFLNIPSSRSLAVLKTGERVLRETNYDGAVLVRVMKSHIRIGTFEYARHFGSAEDLSALTTYTLNRLYPEANDTQNQALCLLQSVMQSQIDLVVNWMRVGFIHGVMNTDNVSISGETFDYGPCAFMNAYDPDTVFSSIDHNGRYAFGNQPKIIKWNIARFAEALLPLLHHEPERAVQLAQQCIDGFDALWNQKYYEMMFLKLGIENPDKEHFFLVDELLQRMQDLNLDYTNTFLMLNETLSNNEAMESLKFKSWVEKWQNIVGKGSGFEAAKEIMKQHNPVYIPRNHLVEEALEAAVKNNLSPFKQLLEVVRTPYLHQQELNGFCEPPAADFEEFYATFCGT